MELNLLLLFILTFVPAVAMPGPNSAFAVAQTLKYGKGYGLLSPIGFAVATAIHSLVVFSGLGLLIKTHSEVFMLIKWLGVGYLFWLAFKAFTSKNEGVVSNTIELSKFKIVSHSVFVSLTNPKAVLVSALVFPLYISPEGNYLTQAITIGFTAMTASFLIYSSYVLLANKLANRLKRTLKINRLMGAIYTGAGAALASVHN